MHSVALEKTFLMMCLYLLLLLISQNLLFTSTAENSSIKVVDFGFARVLAADNPTLTTPCFTLGYAAPEVLTTRGDHGYTQACDLWSLGVVLVS